MDYKEARKILGVEQTISEMLAETLSKPRRDYAAEYRKKENAITGIERIILEKHKGDKEKALQEIRRYNKGFEWQKLPKGEMK